MRTHRSEWLETQQWQLPSELRPVNGLVLTYYDNAPDQQVLRVVLLDARNCLLEYYITSVRPPAPPKYRLTTTYCFGAGLPLWQKMVPDDSASMSNVKFLYLVSLTQVAVVSANTIQPLDIVKVRVCAHAHASPHTHMHSLAAATTVFDSSSRPVRYR